MARAHKCDACGGNRLAWQRMCDSCFRRLPGDIRSGLTEAFRTDKSRWRSLRKRARDFIRADPARAPQTSPESAYARIAAITGDRD